MKTKVATVVVRLARSPEQWGRMDPETLGGNEAIVALIDAQQDIMRLVSAVAGYSTEQVKFSLISATDPATMAPPLPTA